MADDDSTTGVDAGPHTVGTEAAAAADGVNASDPDALAAGIERTREELAETLDALADKVSPKRVAKRTKQQVSDKVTESTHDAVESVKGAAATAKVKASDAKETVSHRAADAKDAVVAKAADAKDAVQARVGSHDDAPEGVVSSGLVTAGGTDLDADPEMAFDTSLDDATTALPPSGAPADEPVTTSGGPLLAGPSPVPTYTPPVSSGLPTNYVAAGGAGALLVLLLVLRRRRRSR